MNLPRISRDHLAVAAALIGPLAAAAALVPARTSFANTDAALVLVAVVVAVAATGARVAGYLAAASSAIWFDFFLTQPYERFTITRRSDIETTVLLLVIGVAVTELAVWGRRQAAASRRAGYVSGLHAAAEAAATAQLSPDSVIRQVSDQLTRLLDLQSCQFQRGYSGVGGPARLNHDGNVTVDHQAWPVDREGLPGGRALELLVESGGVLQGRFLMTPTAAAHPTRENRLVAALLADQVGAAIVGRPSACR